MADSQGVWAHAAFVCYVLAEDKLLPNVVWLVHVRTLKGSTKHQSHDCKRAEAQGICGDAILCLYLYLVFPLVHKSSFCTGPFHHAAT